MEAEIPGLDDVFGRAFYASLAASSPKPERPSVTLAAVPPADDDAPVGRTAADAILAVLTGELERGEILVRCARLATEQWGREKAFPVRTVSLALETLASSGKIRRVKHGVYGPLPSSVVTLAGRRPAGEGRS